MEEYAELQKYLATFKRFPVLNAQEFSRLFHFYQNGTDAEKADARKRIIYGNVRLVVHYAVRYHRRNRGYPITDLMQVGVLGLDKALKKFVPGIATYSTYATWWIKSSIGRYVKNGVGKSGMRVPVGMAEELALIRAARDRFYQKHQSWPDADEIFEIIRHKKTKRSQSITLEKIQSFELYEVAASVSLDGVVSVGENDAATLMDFTIDADESVERNVEALKLYRRMQQAIAYLPARCSEVLRARFGIDGEKEETLKEIGDRLGLTRERIRQIEKEALRLLRKNLGSTVRELQHLSFA